MLTILEKTNARVVMITLLTLSSVISLSRFVSAVMHPVVTVRAPSGTGTAGFTGDAKNIVVALSSPSAGDRFTAALPALLDFGVAADIVAFYLWVTSDKPYDDTHRKKNVIVVGVLGFLVLLTPPLLIPWANIVHYGTSRGVDPYTNGVSTSLCSAFALVAVIAVGTRMESLKEKQRAEELDTELKKVV